MEVTFLTYNVHLFGTWTGIVGTHWNDPERFAILKKCLVNSALYPNNSLPNIVALQECWSKKFVEELANDPGIQDVYPNIYYDFTSPTPPIPTTPSNPSGLVLLGQNNVSFSNATYLNYISTVGWSHFEFPQDALTGKGYYSATVSIDGQTFGLVITHMPTNISTETEGVTKCFELLSSALPQDDSPTVILGDFNVQETKTPYYANLIGSSGTLGQAGFSDGYRMLYPQALSPGMPAVCYVAVGAKVDHARYEIESGGNKSGFSPEICGGIPGCFYLANLPGMTAGDQFVLHSSVGKQGHHRHHHSHETFVFDPSGGALYSTILDSHGAFGDFEYVGPVPLPSTTQSAGYTINGISNSCWQHFGRGNAIDMKRVDYMMCRNATPTSMTVLGPYPQYQWSWLDKGEPRDLSDHYPLLGSIQIG